MNQEIASGDWMAHVFVEPNPKKQAEKESRNQQSKRMGTGRYRRRKNHNKDKLYGAQTRKYLRGTKET
ncbi:MAG: hypothetical protein Q8P67_06680, partial [archaeon]|nr:hypothetical protein [archaeon]